MDYVTLAPKNIVDRTIRALGKRNVEAETAETGALALARIKELIPKGASVMNGSSTTLIEMGFVDYLKSGAHGWNNLHEAIINEKDPAKQTALRKQSVISDLYLGSVHALAETGEFIIASNTGSQLPHVVFTSPNLIFIVSTQKIVPTLEDCFKRLHDHVIPLEEIRMQKAYGLGTAPNKIIIFNGENLKSGRKIRMILVNEKLGF
jgi:L-lactate utilization protein LutC